MQRNELIGMIEQSHPELNTRINQLSVEDFEKFNHHLNKIFCENNNIKIKDKGLTLQNLALIEAYLIYTEKKLSNEKIDIDKEVQLLINLSVKYRIENINFIDFIQLKKYQIGLFWNCIIYAKRINRINHEFVTETIIHAKRTSLPKVPFINFTNQLTENVNLCYSQLCLASGTSLFIKPKEKDKAFYGSFGCVKKAYTNINNELPTFAIKSSYESLKNKKKEAKLNMLFRETYLLENENAYVGIMYTWQPGNKMSEFIVEKNEMCIMPCALNFSLSKRFEALLHLLYQFNLLQEKYRKHDDNAFRNVIFDDINCRFILIDFGYSKKLSGPGDSKNFEFLIMLMQAIFCDPTLFQQLKELDNYDSLCSLELFGKTDGLKFDSRDKLYKLGSPLENAIVRLFWALDHSSARRGNCTFKRAIDYCHDILKKGEKLMESDVIEIANNRLYDKNITNHDIRNGRSVPLNP